MSPQAVGPLDGEFSVGLNVAAYPKRVAQATAWCLRHTWVTFGAMFVLLVAAAIGASRLEVDPSLEAYLRGSDDWARYEAIDSAYGIGETVVIGLREPGGTVFDAETVGAVAELDRIIAEMHGVKRVLSIASASVMGINEPNKAEEVIDAGPLLPPGPITKRSAMTLGSRILNHPIYRLLLVDERHETTFLLVQFDAETSDPVARLAAVRAIRKQADRFQSKSRGIHIAGTPVTKEAIASAVQRDMLYFFPAALVLLMVLLWVMFGELMASMIPVGVVGFSSILVIGLLAGLGQPLNMATATIPTIVFAVGLADSVHFLAELRRQFARIRDRDTALVKTVEGIALPCLLTSATSAAGFAALVSSRVSPLREAGWGAAIGLVGAYLSTMLLTPVLLSAFSYPKRKARPFVTAPRLASLVTGFAARMGRRAFLSAGAIGLAVGICVAALSQLEINSDFLDYLGEGHRLKRDLAVVENTLGGANTVEVILNGHAPGSFVEPKNVAIADRLGRRLREMDELGGTFGYVDYLKFANYALNGRTEEYGVVPPSKEAIAQIMLLNEEVFASLSSPDQSEVRLTVSVPSQPSESMLALMGKVQSTAEDVLKGTGITATITGLPLLFAKTVHHLVEDAMDSFSLAILLIWVAMSLGLGSFRLGTVAMIPSVLPVGLTFATMAVLGFSFDINSAFVACLGLGIAVDDTIHIAIRYQRARSQGSPTAQAALHYALTHGGHPVLLSSLLLMAGFSVLCLSTFTPTFRMGFLAALLVGYATIFDLFVFPVLLLATDALGQFGREEQAEPSTISGYVRNLGSLLTSAPRTGPLRSDSPPN